MRRSWAWSVTLLALTVQWADPGVLLAAPEKPAKAGAERSWLRDTPKQNAAAAPAPSEIWRGVAALVVLAGLALVAFKVKRRRERPQLRAQNSNIKVLSTSRLGPKAHLNVVEVNGRALLLGVTEGSVRHLAWLDEIESPRPIESDLYDPFGDPPLPAQHGLAVSSSQPANENGGGGLFRQVLGGLLGGELRSPAETLALDTEDTVSMSGRAPAQPTRSVEGQAAGLAARFGQAR